jgi:ribonuclease D
MGINTANEYTLTISKEELSLLPTARYSGLIKVIDRPEDVPAAIDDLYMAPVVGFDTETRPSFKKGHMNSLALLQLSTGSTCYLFRINMLGLLPSIRHFLEDPNTLKVGLSIHDDFNNLNKVAPVSPNGFIELQSYVNNFAISDRSLTKIYGILFNMRISKGQRLTNWEAVELTRNQQEYAALDALACVNIYNYLKSGEFDPSQSPYLHPIEELGEEENETAPQSE